MKRILFGFTIGIIVTLSVVVGATYLYNARDVGYNPSNTNWDVDTVEEALNELGNRYAPTSNFIGLSWNYYTSDVTQEFVAPAKGRYKLEVWGAQGGTDYHTGGYGGYSVGEIKLDLKEKLYIVVANKPTTSKLSINGGIRGLSASQYSLYISPGGGATHIAKVTGELKDMEESDRNKVIIVAGGGSGGGQYESKKILGAAGGGYIGNSGHYNGYNNPVSNMASGGEQEKGGIGCCELDESGSFGLGSYGAGAGWYGGGRAGSTAGVVYTGGGGSGFINYKDLKNAAMYCYNCAESTVASINTISTTGSREEADKENCSTGYSSDPISKCAKAGDGYAKITLVSVD